MHVQDKLCVLELFNAVVLTAKVLIDDSTSVVGGIRDGFDLNDIGSSKCGKASIKGL